MTNVKRESHSGQHTLVATFPPFSPRPPVHDCYFILQPRKRSRATFCATPSTDQESPSVERSWQCWKITTIRRMGRSTSHMFFGLTWEGPRNLLPSLRNLQRIDPRIEAYTRRRRVLIRAYRGCFNTLKSKSKNKLVFARVCKNCPVQAISHLHSKNC